MKINVTENKVSIKEEQILNENEYNIHKIQFDFSSEYTDDLVKVALFSIDNHTYKKIISNNECDIPPEVLTQRGYSILGVYAYKTEQDTLVLRYSPSPTKISVYDGSYKADAENSEPITPSEIEQYQQILQNSLQQFQNQYNALVEETEGDIQAIEDELQRKVDEGYFDGEDGFSPIATVTQIQNGARIEIEDENGRTSVDVLNGQDGYSPVRGVDYWTEEDKQEVEEEATQQIDGKIEEYNTNAQNKLNQYNSNATQKTTDYNTNAEQKMSAYNTNASSKLSEYNSNAETKKSAYDENATQKTNSFNTNATNKLTEYNTNHTEKMSAYNSNNTEKLNAFNENAAQKTEDFDEHTEEIQDNIEILYRTDNQILSRFNKDEEVSGQDITLTGTTEVKFAKPPLPMGNSEQVQYSGKNWLPIIPTESKTLNGITLTSNGDGSFTVNGTATESTLILFDLITPVHLPNQTIYVHLRNPSISDCAMIFIGSGRQSAPGLNAVNRIMASSNLIDMELTKIGINVDMGKTVNITFTPSLELTDTATSYEPYVGGTASPNPDYPQEITNVTGDVEVVVENKNLFDKTNYITDVYGIGFDISRLEIGKTYTISSNLPIALMKISNTPGGYNSVVAGNFNNNTFTMTKNENIPTEAIQYIFFRLTGTSGFTTNISEFANYKIQIEESSTSTDYVEHHKQTFTFPLGNEKLMLGDYLADDGIHHVRGQVTESGTTITLNDAKSGGTYLCNKKTAGNLVGKTLTFDTEVTDVLIEYELAEEVITPYTSAQQRVYNEIKNAYSYDEITIITGSSDGSKPFFIVQAYKDLNKELNNKVDKVQGKELSSNDFTDTLKEKLEGLENYDDTEIKADISDIQDEQTEQNTDIEKLQTENARFKATLPTTEEVTGQDITLDKTAEFEFIKPPLPMGNSEQNQYSGKNKFNVNNISASSRLDDAITNNEDGSKIFIKNGLGENGIPLGKISDLCPTLQIGDVIKVYFETNAVRSGQAVNYIYLNVVASILSKAQTIEVTQNVLDSQVFIYAGQTENVYYNNFMFLLSSETDTSFEPYVRTELQAPHHLIHKL